LPGQGEDDKEGDILSKAAMHNAYLICHNVQVVYSSIE
jgi:hypothetical protein